MAESKSTSPWVWLTLLLIVGLFAAFILFLDQKIVSSIRQQDPVSDGGGISSEPVIDFYQILPNRTVEVPVPKAENPTVNAQGRKPGSSTSDHRYLLQAGSFRKPEDADRRKAELALLGLEAKIRRAEVEGVAYHRVELGPFEDDGFYSTVKNRLIANDIHFIAKSSD